MKVHITSTMSAIAIFAFIILGPEHLDPKAP